MRTTLDRFMHTTSILTTISSSSVQNQNDLVCVSYYVTIVFLKRRKTGSTADEEEM